MIGFAKENLAKYDQRKQITLLEGDAVDVLQDLTETYDFVFMDSAKSKYIVFLPRILELIEVGGIVVLDDIFQGGDVATWRWYFDDSEKCRDGNLARS